MPTELRRKRQRSIRLLLALIFIVPLVSLLGLWGFAASVTVSNAVKEHNFNSENQRFGGWAQKLFTQLAQEREQAFMYLSSGRHVSLQPYLAQQQATDRSVTAFLHGLATNTALVTPAVRPVLADFTAEVAWLKGADGKPGIRPAVAAGTVSALTAFKDYDAIIDSEFRLFGSLVVVNNTPLYMQAAASVEAGRAVEMASREATLVAGSFDTGGRMPKSERILFAQSAANRQLLMTDALKQLDPSIGSGFRRADASAAYQNFTALENTVISGIGRKGAMPISPLQLGAATVPLFTAYQAAEKQDRIALSDLGTHVGDQLLEEVGVAGGAGLLAVALSVLLMLGFGRRISRELTGLQHAALTLANDRLPNLMTRLSQGDDVDIAEEAAPLEPGRIAETARVAEAFSSVHRTAIEAAVGQAKLRKGVSQVFRNLAWRSQSLLHRQLALLDGMERRETDPEALDELFQLDHLTTRMRRHAEGLIILSGHRPGRGWRDPVPVMDVLRAAVAEVEAYKRISVICESQDRVTGSAVADVIHLLAELIENAATYSLPTSEVTVRAERVANGFVAEIEDRGIGIEPADLNALNERMQNPPEFDLADSDQLGLFVAARLAARHQIAITLRRSPYGGTTAIVLLPVAIMVTSGEPTLSAFRGEQYANGAQGHNIAAASEQVAALPPGRHEADAPPALSRRTLRFGATSAQIDSTYGNGVAGNAADEDSAAADDAANGGVASDGAPTGGVANGGVANGGVANGGVAKESVADGTGWPERPGPGESVPPPGLPRRQPQASLAPQLREDRRVATGVEDADASGGLTPDGSRALAESLQRALDGARAAEQSADDTWQADATWPPTSSPGGGWPSGEPLPPGGPPWEA